MFLKQTTAIPPLIFFSLGDSLIYADFLMKICIAVKAELKCNKCSDFEQNTTERDIVTNIY